MIDLRFPVAIKHLAKILAITGFLSVCTAVGISPAWSDAASTDGSADGAASGNSDGSANASVNTSSTSTAESTGTKTAKARSRASLEGTVEVVASDGSIKLLKIKSKASAAARSNRNEMVAYARASAQGDTGTYASQADIAAYARSTGQQKTVYVRASDGTYAAAQSGKNAYNEVYAPGYAITTTNKKGRKTVSYAYNTDGSFSMAISKPRSVKAIVGTSTNLAALQAGSTREILRSALYAEAYAGKRKVSAYARAQIDAMSEGAAGYASANGKTEAYASVSRKGKKLILTVVTGKRCGSAGNKNGVIREGCRIKRKVVSLK